MIFMKENEKAACYILGIIVLGTLLLTALPISHGNGTALKKAATAAELTSIKLGLNAYKVEFGEFPKGDQIQIVKALTGQNPKKITFIVFHPHDFNERDELIDRWGTPVKISIMSQTTFSITSAGPDKLFGQKDDLIEGNIESIRSTQEPGPLHQQM